MGRLAQTLGLTIERLQPPKVDEYKCGYLDVARPAHTKFRKYNISILPIFGIVESQIHESY